MLSLPLTFHRDSLILRLNESAHFFFITRQLSVQGNYVNPHTNDDEPRPRDDHAAPCPAATTPRLPPPRPRRRAAREAELPVGSTRPLHRRAAAKMSPRIRTGPEAVLTAHAPTPSAAAATARRKPDQVPIPEQNFFYIYIVYNSIYIYCI